MARLIDADALVAELQKKPIHDGHFIHTRDVSDAIFNAPTISPDDVRGFGKWEKETICYSRCSNCKKLIQTAELVEYKALDEQGGFCVIPSIEKYDINYCPNCGARMSRAEAEKAMEVRG